MVAWKKITSYHGWGEPPAALIVAQIAAKYDDLKTLVLGGLADYTEDCIDLSSHNSKSSYTSSAFPVQILLRSKLKAPSILTESTSLL
jgi:hypothetical protein